MGRSNAENKPQVQVLVAGFLKAYLDKQKVGREPYISVLERLALQHFPYIRMDYELKTGKTFPATLIPAEKRRSDPVGMGGKPSKKLGSSRTQPKEVLKPVLARAGVRA